MPKISENIKTAFFTVLFIFLFLFLFTKVLGPIPFAVNSITTNKNDMFTVSGEGEETAVPTKAQFSVGITGTAATVEAAKNNANEVMNAVTDALKAAGIKEKDIKTTNYNINPEYDYSAPIPLSSAATRPAIEINPIETSKQPRIVGYTASQNITVTAESVDIANKALDAATANGANNVGGVTFTLEDEDREKLEETARKEAIEQAKSKAQKIAKAAGIRLGRVVNIQESGSGMPYPMAFDRAELSMGAAKQETDLQPGENTVRVSVTLFYETY